MRVYLSLVFIALLLPWHTAAAEMVISHRSPESLGDERERYNLKLITLALELTRAEYGPYQLRPIPPMNTPRSLFAAGLNIYPNLLIEMSYEPDIGSANELDFIPFPVDLGLVGYRVCFVSPQARKAVRQVKTLADLRRFTIGQGVGWTDTRILRHNGIKVSEVSNYANLFRMVASNRVDLFCRGINEVLAEMLSFGKDTELLLDDHLLLVYPLPRFYYLSLHNTQARERIALGLERAWKTGELQALWQSHYMDNILALKLDQRLLLRLENPLLDGLSPAYKAYTLDPIKLAHELTSRE